MSQDKNEGELELWIWALAIASYIRDSTFNVANWIFCFEYYRTASLIPYFFNSDTVPAKFMSRMNGIFNGILYCNFIAPFLRAFFQLMSDLNGLRNNSTAQFWLICYIIAMMWVGLMQLVSAIFLGLALNNIRRFHISHSSLNSISRLIITLHCVALILYLVSTVIYFAFTMVYYSNYQL